MNWLILAAVCVAVVVAAVWLSERDYRRQEARRTTRERVAEAREADRDRAWVDGAAPRTEAVPRARVVSWETYEQEGE